MDSEEGIEDMAKRYRMCGDWRLYSGLDCRSSPPVYARWVKVTGRMSGLSAYLSRAKESSGSVREDITQAWIETVWQLPIGGATVVVPVVGSRVLRASADSWAYQLAARLAQYLGIEFDSQSLWSRRYQPLHDQPTAIDRSSIVRGSAGWSGPMVSGLVVLVDDFVTRGDTMAESARAIRLACPGVRVLGVVVGKTERENQKGQTLRSAMPQSAVSVAV